MDSQGNKKIVDVVIVGAGFSGLYLIHKLRNQQGLNVVAYERGSGVGGTWYWNRYPGARCDIESMEYSYSFDDALQQEWCWSHRYATQPEILKYLNHVADRFDLRKDITFNTNVISAVYKEDTQEWEVKTDKETVYSKYCIMATGCLSATNLPPFKGLDTFKGEFYHTARWPQEGVDFTGKKVGVIGTGSSAIQSIPRIAEQAEHLTVFQRTANYSIPANNRPLTAEYLEEYKKRYNEVREKAKWSCNGFSQTNMSAPNAFDVSEEERNRLYQFWWDYGGLHLPLAYNDISTCPKANLTASEFVRARIRAKINDPEVAKILVPEIPIGTKRLLADTNYYETFNRDNVSVVCIKNKAIKEVTPTGVIIGETGNSDHDKEFELDALVFATGFDALTGALVNIDIRGEGGKKLKEKWYAGPRTYLGLMTSGFPNMFMVTGPGSPSVLSAMNITIEHHVEWICDCIEFLNNKNCKKIDASLEHEDRWVEHLSELAQGSLMNTANSWYLGANVPGKPRVFMPYIGGVHKYRQKCDEVVAQGYAGFVIA